MKDGYLPHSALSILLSELRHLGFECIGPQVKDGAISYEKLTQASNLPYGIEIEQTPGHYRIKNTDTSRCFAWANGAQALKPLLFSPYERLWITTRDTQGKLTFKETIPDAIPTAVFGVRACDLAALDIQDQHFLKGSNPDPAYQIKRQSLLLIAVNCTHPSDTCFCASTGDGPQAITGYDLLIDELDEGFTIRSGSEQGKKIISSLPLQEINSSQLKSIDFQNKQAYKLQTRSLPSRNLNSALFDKLDHPQWEAIAQRCLSCGNCTSVCPTCFCFQELETAELDGTKSTHSRRWDSCFTQEHSYIHGYTIRDSTRLRYRQWLTHKLGSWHEQYGRSGCVGCGRCISWCPVGIDLTTEVAKILEADHD